MTFYAIFIMVIQACFVSLCISAILLAILMLLGKKIERKGKFFLFVFYLSMLYYVTVFRGGLFQNKEHLWNYIPFDALLETSYYQALVLGSQNAILLLLYNVIGNIVWFMPLGMYFKEKSLCKVACFSMLISISIEVMQYLLYTGISDIDDIILNTLGGMLGYFVCRIRFKEMVINYDN